MLCGRHFENYCSVPYLHMYVVIKTLYVWTINKFYVTYNVLSMK